MTTKEIHKEIKTKRDQYLLGIISQFKESDEEKNIFNCYDYVKLIINLSKDTFLNSLSKEVREIVIEKYHIWFIPIESQSTFAIFMQSNNINLN